MFNCLSIIFKEKENYSVKPKFNLRQNPIDIRFFIQNIKIMDCFKEMNKYGIYRGCSKKLCG